jgi:tRNA nucleotidyltransferase (CCA-adding enzyme)
MALDPSTLRLVDPFGGQADVAARLIRAVGDPEARFREDGLRVLRAVRFMATLEFGIDPATEAAIPSALDSLAKVSSERVKDELMKLLGARVPSIGLGAAERTGILGVILPELTEGVGVTQNRFHVYDVWQHTVASVDATPPDPMVRMGALLHDVAKPRTAAPREDSPSENTFYRHDSVGAEMSDAILRRLKFSNRDRERIVAMVGNHMFWYTPEWSDATVRRFLRRVGKEGVSDLFALRKGDVVGRGRGEDPEDELGGLRRRIEAVLEEEQALSVSDLAVTGQDVMAALGTSPGPIVGEVLRALLERVIEDPSQNQREGLLSVIPQVADRIKGHGSV